MTNPGIFRHSYLQDETIFDQFLPLPEVEVYNDYTKDSALRWLDTFISNYADTALERMYQVLQGDMLGSIVSNLATSDAPDVIQEMRQNILASDQAAAERHLLVFLHELHTCLDQELQRYKLGELPPSLNVPHAYFRGRDNHNKRGEPFPFNHSQAEADAEEQKFEATHGIQAEYAPRFHSGNPHKHFLEYFKNIYKRAKIMREYIDFCFECSWINQPIEAFRNAARIIMREVGGVIVQYMPDEADAGTNNAIPLHVEYQVDGEPEPRVRDISSEHVGIQVPVNYEDIHRLKLSVLDKSNIVGRRGDLVVEVFNTGDRLVDILIDGVVFTTLTTTGSNNWAGVHGRHLVGTPGDPTAGVVTFAENS